MTHIDNLEPNILWYYYQKGYRCLVYSGRYFRRLLRPALSHVYFQRAVPLLVAYARANHGAEDLPPGFSDEMEACPLTARDLLHMDYAICLGYAEAQGENPVGCSVMEWPGPSGLSNFFIAADVIADFAAFSGEYTSYDPEDSDDTSEPPFDL